ncbi:ATP-binding protein [Halarcobacter anaerophilus]|uniref:histidine kinase n=1 Tax=Halarcobacter anaerophilus TaxID=877500 RepID=A0A4Q0Y1Y6_9BACT|nr:ATP-binding protein [Halarcobacter anaerophilus]QDF29726.1 Cache sensor-containing signal transduction histidine kinase [Halarcobacter anaerophilus]RXJ62649.1 hypothetical protein CRV06_09280 [Halarcobacter anaerophilus]
MKNRSLKRVILQVLIFFTMSVIVIIGILSIINIYNSKVDLIKFNQNLVLNQVNNKIYSMVHNIEYISEYISKKYSTNSSNQALQNLLETNRDISSIFILNKDGILENFYIKAKTREHHIYKGFDYSNKVYYKKLRDKNSYWSNLFLSSIDETPTLSYSFKMRNKIGVILIDITQISNFIGKFRNQDESYMIRVFDRNSVLVINPVDIKYVLQRYNASSTETFTKLVKENSPLKQDIFFSALDEEEQFGSYLKNSKTGWYIIVRESFSEILKSLKSVILTYVILIIFFIIIAVYLSFLISKRIFLNFDKIQAVTSHIANGNYDEKVEESSFDEFNKLLKSFYKMQKEIDKREDSLEKSLESFKSLFNSTMESVVLSNCDEIIDVNDVTVKLFGFKSKSDVIGKNMFDYIVDDYKDVIKENLKKDVKEPYEIECIKDDGTIIHALVQGKFLELNSKIVRVSALIDITEVKNKDKLLFQQTKMASMGEMIGNIAHQWRQPLNVISTSASSVKLEKEFGVLDDKQLNNSMDTIVQNALYLSKTIDDFRNFFKTDKSLESFELKEVVQKALKLLHSSIYNHNIKVITKFSNRKIIVEGYPNEFIQVLINIINNAKDAFLSNQIENRIIEIREEIHEKCYKLRILDNAGGIPDSIIYKVFDPYFTTKHKSQGTGIGLYMSHQIIVDHMKGDFYVRNINYRDKNQNFKGCCFTIKLPKNSLNDYIYEI